jgi:hypothetical protein
VAAGLVGANAHAARGPAKRLSATLLLWRQGILAMMVAARFEHGALAFLGSSDITVALAAVRVQALRQSHI